MKSFRFIFTPRWIALTLLCLALLPAFASLSNWQWRRLHQRQALNAVITTNTSAAPAPLADLTHGNIFDAKSQWRTAQACGHWDASHQVLVRRKSLYADLGFWVATPFVTDAGQTVVVVRGWIAAGESSVDSPTVTAPPLQSCVTLRMRSVTNRVKPKPQDIPAGQTDALIPREIEPGENTIAQAYGELLTSGPASDAGLTLLPAPEVTEGPHRSYALQWIFFAIMTVIGWVILVRNEHAAQVEDSAN